MRSLGSTVPLEWALRGVACIAIALALRDSFATREGAGQARVIDGGRLFDALRVSSPDTLIVRTDTALSATARDWLHARIAAGAPVRWTGRVPAVAITVDAPHFPNGPAQARIAGVRGQIVSLRDSLGIIDSLTLVANATAIDLGTPIGATIARVAEQQMAVRVPHVSRGQHVSVIGRAGWESKFVIAALEEQGWRVSSRVLLRPDTAVTQGTPTRFDGEGTAVVVALDETAAPFAARLAAFVRGGGGLVLGAEAIASSAFAALRPGMAGAAIDAEVLAVTDSAPRRALAMRPSVRLITDAVALETRRGAVALAARRFGAGRVVSAGYSDSWRWRMIGPDGAEAKYRQWWSGVVAAASGNATVPAPLRVETHSAPRVDMVAALGQPIADRAQSTRVPAPARRWRWSLVAAAVLLLEWGFRRVRGAR
jgi:hypothetical protein